MNFEEIQAEDDRLITEDVARAIEERELIAYYQPQFDIRDNRMAAIEALVRWTQPDGTVVLPSLFVPSLERTDTILGLDWYMIEEAASFAERMRGTKLDLPISVNLSHWHFSDPDFVKKLCASVDWHGVSHESFAIEINERAFCECDDAKAWVEAVQAEGFMVAIDDFGTSQNSLEVLRSVPGKAFKAGRSFIEHSVADERSRKVAGAMFELAHDLGMFTIAQGVETPEELEVVKSLACDAIQGFYYAKPMSEADLIEFAK